MKMEASAYLTTFTWVAMVLSFFLAIAWLFFKHHNSTLSSLPGPWGLPIIGHFHLLDRRRLHRSLHKLSTIHGPIMHIRLGLVSAVVVSSPKAAELFLKTHDANIASKPFTQLCKYVTYGGQGIVFSEYGQYWGKIRKLCTVHLFSAAKTDSFRFIRQKEIGQLIKLLKGVARRGEVVDISSCMGFAVEEIAYRMIFGLRAINERLKPCIQECLRLGAAPNLADYIPFIGAFDLQGYTRRWKDVSKIMDEILENIIDEHEHDTIENRDQLGGFINVLMSLMKSNNPEEKVDRNQIKANMLEILAAGMDTSTRTTEWAFSELLRHPQVMKRIQQELELVVGLDRLVEESDLENLEYLGMVVKESMRLHPAIPTYVHESINDMAVNGTKIPSKRWIIINSWAIGRDPVAWPEKAEEFYPERFFNSQIDVRGHDMQLLPFGSGRRKCPGIEMGMRTVKLMLAQMMHCFNWELPDGISPEDLDMEEEIGLTVPRANPLLAVPSYRLCIDHI